MTEYNDDSGDAAGTLAQILKGVEELTDAVGALSDKVGSITAVLENHKPVEAQDMAQLLVGALAPILSVNQPQRKRKTRRVPPVFPDNDYGRAWRTIWKRGTAWVLTEQEYGDLIRFPCVRCAHNLGPTGVRLVRKDPSKPYTQRNVEPCCPDCALTRGQFK